MRQVLENMGWPTFQPYRLSGLVFSLFALLMNVLVVVGAPPSQISFNMLQTHWPMTMMEIFVFSMLLGVAGLNLNVRRGVCFSALICLFGCVASLMAHVIALAIGLGPVELERVLLSFLVDHIAPTCGLLFVVAKTWPDDSAFASIAQVPRFD